MEEITFLLKKDYVTTQNDLQRQLGDCEIKINKIKLSLLTYKGVRLTVLYYFLSRLIGIFRKDIYLGVIISKEKKVVSSAICHPISFRYPFMEGGDYQIGAVNTVLSHRQQGFSLILLNSIMSYCKAKRYWYVFYSDNLPSIALAKKLGFNTGWSGVSTLSYLNPKVTVRSSLATVNSSEKLPEVVGINETFTVVVSPGWSSKGHASA